jgi:hypothetical protein
MSWERTDMSHETWGRQRLQPELHRRQITDIRMFSDH